MLRNVVQNALIAVGIGLLAGALVVALSARAQEFSAAFAAELGLQPPPAFISSTDFTLLLGVTVADAWFVSQTRYDLTAFQSQLFSLGLSLEDVLIVQNRLLFQPALVFKRNELQAFLGQLGFRLAAEVLLEDLGPPGPSVHPGLVIEAGGRSELGLGLISVTGFGVTRVVEDLVTVIPCSPLELACLNGPYSDDRFDRLVAPSFVFSEQAIRLDLTVGQVTLAATPLFTASGFAKLLLELELLLSELGLRFSAISTFDPTPALVYQALKLEVTSGPLQWRSVTTFSGAPIFFDTQTFKLILTLKNFSLLTTVILTPAGLGELRLGVGFAF
jgi:hypothetical protein